MSTSSETKTTELGKVKPDGVIQDRWYWVRVQDGEWFPASWDEFLGWTNSDCWDDMRNEVIEWKLIPLPEDISA